jgi:hypothetical protein
MIRPKKRSASTKRRKIMVALLATMWKTMMMRTMRMMMTLEEDQIAVVEQF